MSIFTLVFGFAAAIFIAIVITILCCRQIKKNTHTQDLSAFAINQGRPISGGVKHFKIVNK